MSFRKDYSNIKGVCLEESLECIDILDHLTHKMRDEKCCGLFGYRCDPIANEKYYTFYNYVEHLPLGSYVYLDKDINTIYIEFENRLIGFNLDHIQKTIEERKNELYNR